jgi:hypothetical protein
MAEQPTFQELRGRIQRDLEHFGGKLPERVAISWSGYLAALIEWGMISVADHKQLCALLPHIDDNPAVAILLGREDA